MTNFIRNKRIFTSPSFDLESDGGGISLVTTDDKIKSLVQGTNVTIVDNGDGTITISSSGGGGSAIVEVANYSALPAANTVTGELYAVLASQGTYWLPGSLGGTYYNKGLYYSDGSSWVYTETPYNATQATVNTGTNNDQFVTPSTLFNSTQWATKEDAIVYSGVATEYYNGQGNWATPSGIVNSYTTQSFTAQTSVVLTHNFGAYPVVQIIESNGDVFGTVLGINHTSTSSFTVTFSVATTGTIIASVGSPQAQTFISVSGNYSVLNTDQIVYATSVSAVITLPTAVGNTGKIFTITNGSVGNITVNTTSSQTISGNLTLLLNSYDSIDVYSNGTNYLIK